MQNDSGPQRLLKSMNIPITATKSLQILQERSSGSATGWLVWPVAQSLCKFLVEHSDHICGKSVLEVGAGTGLVGLTCASLGSELVVITDMADSLPICRSNVSTNISLIPASCKVYVEELLWGCKPHLEALLGMHGAFDVIVASDVVYHQSEEVLGGLAESILAASNRNTVVLIAYEDREGLIDDELYFFSPMRDRFASLSLVDLGHNRAIYRFSDFIE